jgi:hypothetical protein
MVGGMGLGLAAMVALDVLMVRLTGDKAPWIAGTAIGVFMLLSVIGMYLLARALTLPKQRPLASGVPLVNVHRLKVYAWAKRAGVAIVGFAVVGLILPDPWNVLGYLLAGLCAFFAAFLLPICFVSARDQDRALTAGQDS